MLYTSESHHHQWFHVCWYGTEVGGCVLGQFVSLTAVFTLGRGAHAHTAPARHCLTVSGTTTLPTLHDDDCSVSRDGHIHTVLEHITSRRRPLRLPKQPRLPQVCLVSRSCFVSRLERALPATIKVVLNSIYLAFL